MEWYIPFTMLPGVAMLIFSTTGQMMALSSEIGNILSSKASPFQHQIADKKIKQLSRLTTATALLYISAACTVLSGVLGVIADFKLFPILAKYILVLGVILLLVALARLISYGVHAINIRKEQHQHNHEM